jgi:hypothetical protein
VRAGHPGQHIDKTEDEVMILTAILLVFVLFAVAGYWWRSRPSPARPLPASAGERYASVEIRPRSGACAAAHALAGQLFLAQQAPALPLDGCTKTRCDCTFAKRSDRRTDDRRWGHEGLGAAMFVNAERRSTADRREAD